MFSLHLIIYFLLCTTLNITLKAYVQATNDLDKIKNKCFYIFKITKTLQTALNKDNGK